MLTSKQRSLLRRLANGIEPIFQIGKGGVNDNMVQQIVEALEARELVKVTILPSALLKAREACDDMAKRTGAEPVQSIGNRFVLYKESVDHKRILLD